jgi:ABC-2 type transport system permease protein
MSPFDFTGTGAVIYKEIRHILREPTTLAFILVLPLVELIIYGYAINLHVEHVATIYYNGDGGPAARQLIRALEHSETFHVVREVQSPTQLQQLLVAGSARVAFDIPAGFSATVGHGRTARVRMLVDGSDSNIALAAYGSAARIASVLSEWYDPFGANPAVDISSTTLFNPSLRSANFLIPGLIGVIIQNITMVLTTLSIVRERDRGTLDQMRAMSIGPGAIVFGTAIPYGVIGFIDLVLVLLAMRNVFGVPVVGNVPFLLALSAAFIATGLGFGLLISTIARSQLQAMMMAVFFLLPSVLLSGMIFEVEMMPKPAQVIAYALPLTYFLQILRGVIVRGAGVADLWLPTLVTCLFGIGALILATVRFAARSS